MFSYFTAPSRAGDKWFFVGRASSFPDLGQDEEEVGVLSQPRPCGGDNKRPGCKAFHVPQSDSSKSREVPILVGEEDDSASQQQASDIGDESATDSTKLEEQVLVFRYKGKFHAVDHVSAIPPSMLL